MLSVKSVSFSIIGCIISIVALLHSPNAHSQENSAPHLQLLDVSKNVYAIVGPLGNRTRDNLANNATFGFVVTSEGVVLIDPGGSYNGAKAIHDIIKSVTLRSIKYVINTGGQDHRWLGNDYFKKLGATVVASKPAVIDQKSRVKDILIMLGNTAGDDAMAGTTERYADIAFDEYYRFTLGGETFELFHVGKAHSPGDSFVWMPEREIMFSGDIVYVERMLSVMAFSNTRAWVNTYERLASFNPKIIVPGHGKPTSLEDANHQTLNYLKHLRLTIKSFMEEGGAIEDVGKIDQSEFFYLENYDLLKGRNAQQVYQEMEWE